MEAYVNQAWHRELLTVSRKLSNKKIADRLGVSASQVSQVINGKYRDCHIKNFRERFRGAFMGECVTRPIAGELSRDKCLAFQASECRPTNPIRVQMYHACRSGCENSRIPAVEID